MLLPHVLQNTHDIWRAHGVACAWSASLSHGMAMCVTLLVVAEQWSRPKLNFVRQSSRPDSRGFRAEGSTSKHTLIIPKTSNTEREVVKIMIPIGALP